MVYSLFYLAKKSHEMGVKTTPDRITVFTTLIVRAICSRAAGNKVYDLPIEGIYKNINLRLTLSIVVLH